MAQLSRAEQDNSLLRWDPGTLSPFLYRLAFCLSCTRVGRSQVVTALQSPIADVQTSQAQLTMPTKGKHAKTKSRKQKPKQCHQARDKQCDQAGIPLSDYGDALSARVAEPRQEDTLQHDHSSHLRRLQHARVLKDSKCFAPAKHCQQQDEKGRHGGIRCRHTPGYRSGHRKSWAALMLQASGSTYIFLALQNFATSMIIWMRQSRR
ncbi:hypothetical protein BDZ88DRAFT_305244 [Geranomyces variabilis]|nr:hypothetical protein BDZ88DRAFT_305244 [Geranomyces variabilis]